MNPFLFALFSIFPWLSGPSSPASVVAGGAEYRYYQSEVRELPIGPKSPAYAVCDMLETFTGVPARLDAEALRANEREHSGTGSMATFYQYMLERKGLLRLDPQMDSTNQDSFIHYICPTGSVLSFAESSKINAPNKIVSLLNQGIKGIVVTYEYCPKDWKKGNWKLGEKKGKHHPKAFHTVLIVGQQDSSFIFKNSWGKSWGDGGYGLMSFDYHRKHAREGIVTYLAEAVQPKTSMECALAIKLQPELLEGKPFVQVSLVGRSMGKMPTLLSLNYLLRTQTGFTSSKQALLMANAQSTGYPCMIPLPSRDEKFGFTITYSKFLDQIPNKTHTLVQEWKNGEIDVL